MATATKKPKAKKETAPAASPLMPAVPAAAPAPQSVVQAPIQGGNAIAAMLAQKNVAVATPEKKKDKSSPEALRPDLNEQIQGFLEGSYLAKAGASQMGQHELKLKTEAEAERLKLCIKDKKFHKSCDIGNLVYKVGSFSVAQPFTDPKAPEKSITIEMLDAAWAAAFGSMDNAKKYICWVNTLQLKIKGKSEAEVAEIYGYLLDPQNSPKKFTFADLYEYVPMLVLKKDEAGADVLLMKDYSLDETVKIGESVLKVRDAVKKLTSEQKLSMSLGSLNPDQEALVKIGEQKVAEEKAAKDALAAMKAKQ